DGFLAAFDRVYNSFRLGKGKRDPTLFDDVIADLDLAPERVLFIDDAPANGERARERGLRVLTTRDPDRIEQALMELIREAEGTSFR
ncbi:MAG: HAD-IA family hydrolase, partial [Thiohalorhabdaceae bacterium]